MMLFGFLEVELGNRKLVSPTYYFCPLTWRKKPRSWTFRRGFPDPQSPTKIRVKRNSGYEVDASLKLQHVFVRELKTQSTIYIVLYIYGI